MSASQQKRNAAVCSNPLLDAGILLTVLSYVGLGHCLFVAPVSTWWRYVYKTLPHQQLTVCDEYGYESVVLCDPEMTLFSSVFASPSRVELAQKSGLGCNSEPYQCAAGKHADIATLAAAHEAGMEYTEAVIAAAALCNKLAEVQYLHTEDCPWPVQLLDDAARGGHFELVRWCYEHGCRFESSGAATCMAAVGGSVELMGWLLQQEGAKLYEAVLTAAACKGHTAMVHYLLAQQCPWDAHAIRSAASGGHVDLLQWLMDNGCPLEDEDDYDEDDGALQLGLAAAAGGSIEVLTHLRQQGMLLEDADSMTRMLNSAGHNDQLPTAKWLREQGAEWPTAPLHPWRDEEPVWSDEVLAWATSEGFTAPAV
jgi:hypothetical protein